MDYDDEVSVKDIVNFHIRINNASKAKRALARLSSKDKLTAFGIIDLSTAHRDFKIEVAKYFVYDLDMRVRRKAETMLEALVPGWVADPGESILALLKSAGGKGPTKRNAAVRFLFGIIDANSLRDTLLTLLNSRNREHMVEIIAILEEYIDSSGDEAEQVKIFDGCLDIVLSDEVEHSVKHHACNLLSVFFKKVASTQLGEILHQKYIERQVEKAESVHRYLCSGSAGLNTYFLEDLIRPLNEGGRTYQLKMVGYFAFVIEKIRDPATVDAILDTYPDSWSMNEPPREEKVELICRRIMQALEELWDATDDVEVRALIMGIKYNEYHNKRELLEQIRNRLDDQRLSPGGREKVLLMLRCFLRTGEDETLRFQAARLLLLKGGDTANRLAGLEQLVSFVERRNLNTTEASGVAAGMESLLEEDVLDGTIRSLGRYLLFVAAPERILAETEQMALLEYLLDRLENNGLGERSRERVRLSLAALEPLLASDDLRDIARYLESKLEALSDAVVAEQDSA